MGKGGAREEPVSCSSAATSIDLGEYAPSPNTCSQALTRANQLRVQALLRQLIVGAANKQECQQRLDTLRLLRKTFRELDYRLSWLTQVDFFETIERILREENEIEPSDWRLINDSTQLLIESIPRFAYEVDMQTIGQIFASVVQNLGHQRSEVRRSSLLLINMYINERAGHFQHILKIFIEYGLANHRNQQAQRGAILSLPLLMTEQVVEGEDLLPLVRCLGELLVDADAQLFYSLYLALQRLHMTVGEQKFNAYLRQCDPEASLLYKQAASRNNSIASTLNPAQLLHVAAESQVPAEHCQQQQANQENRRGSKYSLGNNEESSRSQEQTDELSEPKQVTFEEDNEQQKQQHLSPSSETSNGSFVADDTEDETLLELTHDQQLAGAPSLLKQTGDNFPAFTSMEENELMNDNNQSAEFEQVKQLSSSSRPSLESSSVSSTSSSRAHLVDPSHYMNAAALHGRPMSGYEEIHHVDHSNIGLAINDLGTCCSPTFEVGPAAQNELKFGIFPKQLVSAALNSRYLDRYGALQEMMTIIRDSPINHLAILMTYFDSFLEQFLTKLMESGTDYKVELVAIDMIETIVIKTKISTMQYVRPIIGLLMKTMGDSRAIFRDNTIRVIHKMMAFLPPQHVIDAIFEHKHNKNALIREESVNRVTAAVLQYDKNEFNLTKLCYHILPMLADQHANVRLASLECIATLANALGQERIGSLLTAAEAVQTGCDYDGLLDAIHARLMRRTLPRCNPDGSIRYVIKPFLNLANANYHQEHQAADVSWVLEAPSSHQHIVQVSDLSPLPEQLHLRLHHAHPQHRSGVYSPPDMSQRRASMAVVGQLQETQHHHHHHNHESRGKNNVAEIKPKVAASTVSQQKAGAEGTQSVEREVMSGEKHRRAGPSPTTAASGSSRTAIEQQTGRRSSRDAAQASHQSHGYEKRLSLAYDSTVGQPESNRSEIEHKGSIKSQCDAGEDIKRADLQVPSREASGECSIPKARRQSVRSVDKKAPKVPSLPKSYSQDSSSSTDTNKVLFKYYLSKFKQSLTDTTNGIVQPVLPSDSIIYTDTQQAYELSRHQSRQQQTSFDYDSDSVGRVPGSAPKTNQSKQSRHRHSSSQSGRLSLNQLEPVETNQLSSSSESPLTVMESSRLAHDRQQRRASRQQSGEEKQPVEEQQQFASSRRKSVSEKRSQYSSNDSRSAGEAVGEQASKSATTEANLMRRKSVAPQPEDRSDTKRELERTDSRQENSREQQVPSQSQSQSQSQIQRQKGNLVRQSASAAIASDEELEASRDNESLAIESSFKQLEEEKSTGGDEESRSNRRQTNRQESVSTSDSQKSQQFSDHATQTVNNTGADTDAAEDRQTRRRRSRRSSKRRESKELGQTIQQKQKSVADCDFLDQDDPSGQLGEGGSNDEEFEVRKRASRSQPPVHRQQLNRTLSRSQLRDDRSAFQDSRRAVSVSPSLATNVNIRNILENVASVEGPFQEPQLAFKVAMDALEGPCWSTKVEGILALIRLATFHQAVILAHLHEVVGRVAAETKNLRSTVSRSAIFALGDFSAKLKRSIEPELENIVQALLHKSIENTAFIRDDIRKAFGAMLDNLTQWRFANALIHHGANHKNMHVRRMASQFIALLVERMGPAKCLVGARDISAQLIPATAKFAQDSSPHTRYYGRLVLAKIMHHSAFDRLLRKNLVPNLYRSTVGIIESVKRRGPGEAPTDN